MYEEFTQNRIAQLRMQKNVSARDMSLTLGQNNSLSIRLRTRKPCRLYKVCSISVNTSVSRHSNFLMMATPIPSSLPIWLRI